MANLGDKSYNYNYYGVPVDRKWSTGTGTEAVAALVRPNIWGYRPTGIYYDDGQYANTDKNGKPLDTTIAVWRLPNNASYACNAMFSVDISTSIKAHYDVNIENGDVPLAVAAIDVTSNNWGTFSRRPWHRYAYDTVMACNGPRSVLAYDIVYNSVCLFPDVFIFNRSNTSQSTIALSSIASTIGTNDKIDLMFIRPRMYRGGNNNRINTAVTIPDDNAPYFDGVLLADTLSVKPIAHGQAYLKSLIADTANGHNYRSDVVYNPFSTQYQQVITDGAGTNSAAFQLQIGFVRQLTKSNIVNGYTSLGGGNRITAQFYRCNYNIKYFDDVVYQWEDVIFDDTNAVEIQNGFNISGYNNTDNFRFYTRLKIIDAKGNTKGKAIELAVKHELAYIGFYFCDTQTGAESKSLGTGDGVGVYLPEIVGGVTTGRYFTGADIQNVPYARSGSVADDAFIYDPDESEESGDSTTIINTGTIGSGVTYYALTNAEMNNLSTWLNTTYQPTDQDTFIQDFKGTNPADYVASCVYYPFDIPLVSTNVPIVVGKLTAGGAQGATLAYTYGQLYDYGYYDIPMFGDFRDYLTQITVFVPFCGTVKLDPIMWVGHRLSVKMAIDWPTGVCTGFIFRDSTMYDSVSGTIGVQLPLSAVANGSYQVAITNLLASHKAAHRSLTMGAIGVAGGLATAAGGAATGNLKLAAGGLLSAVTGVSTIDSQADKMENIDYNIDHTQPSVTEVSGGSPFINCGTDLRVRILRTTPMMLPGYDASVYAKTIGFADCRTVANLSAERGLTVCTNIDTSGLTVPLEVIAELNKACKEGLIL